MSDMLKFKDRKYVAVLYPEDPTHVAAIEKLQTGGYDFAAILHDSDVYESDGEGHKKGDLKKPHWHVVVRFSPNALWNTAVAKDLGIEVNYLEKCRNLNKALLYLVHRDHLEKFQYDLDKVFGSQSMISILSKLLTEEDEGLRVLSIVKMVEDCPGYISPTELLKKACKDGYYGEFRRMGVWSKIIVDEHNEEIFREERRQEDCRLSRERFDDSRERLHDMPFPERVERLDRIGRTTPPLPLND